MRWVDGRPEPRTTLCVTVTVDHDIVDGAPAARFGQTLTRMLEDGAGLDDEFAAEAARQRRSRSAACSSLTSASAAPRTGSPASDRPVRLLAPPVAGRHCSIPRNGWRETHGGFARYQVLRHVFTLVASADANRRMFVQAPGNYPRGRQYDNLALLIGRGLICAEGADWQRQRKLAQPVFDKALMARVVEITGVLTAQLLARWDRARERGEQVDVLDGHAGPGHAGDRDGPLQPRHAAPTCAKTPAARPPRRRTASPRPCGPARRSSSCGTSAPPAAAVGPGRLQPPLPPRLARPSTASYTSGSTSGSRRPRRHYDDIMGELVRGYGDRARRLRRELRDQAVTLFFAGFETTAVALAWTWLLLSQNPAAEARFHEELATRARRPRAHARGPEVTHLHEPGHPGIPADVSRRSTA